MSLLGIGREMQNVFGTQEQAPHVTQVLFLCVSQEVSILPQCGKLPLKKR